MGGPTKSIKKTPASIAIRVTEVHHHEKVTAHGWFQ